MLWANSFKKKINTNQNNVFHTNDDIYLVFGALLCDYANICVFSPSAGAAGV